MGEKESQCLGDGIKEEWLQYLYLVSQEDSLWRNIFSLCAVQQGEGSSWILTSSHLRLKSMGQWCNWMETQGQRDAGVGISTGEQGDRYWKNRLVELLQAVLAPESTGSVHPEAQHTFQVHWSLSEISPNVWILKWSKSFIDFNQGSEPDYRNKRLCFPSVIKTRFHLFVWNHMFSWDVFWESKAERKGTEWLCTVLPCGGKKDSCI